MLYPNKDRQNLEELEELASLQNRVKIVRLQDKLGKQKFPEDMKKTLEPVMVTIKITSEKKIKSFDGNLDY